MKRMFKLPNRLMTVAGLIENGASVIDVGTDHGLLPVHLALIGQANRIIASDMSAGSLMAAERTAAKYGMADRIQLLVAPGLTGINENDADTIVIAGVGGETMIEIFEESPWFKNGKRLILQPQTKKEELLDFLSESGCEILDIKHTADRGRTYIVILAEGKQCQQ